MRVMVWLKHRNGKLMIEASTGEKTEFLAESFPSSMYETGSEAMYDVYTNDELSVHQFHRESAGIRLKREFGNEQFCEYSSFKISDASHGIEYFAGKVQFPVGCSHMFQGFPEEFYMVPVHPGGRGSFSEVWNYAKARERLFPVSYFKAYSRQILVRGGVINRGTRLQYGDRYLQSAPKVLEQLYGHWVMNPEFEHDTTFRFKHPWSEPLQMCNVIGFLSKNMFYAGALASKVSDRMKPDGSGSFDFDPLVAFGAQCFRCALKDVNAMGRKELSCRYPWDFVDAVERALVPELNDIWLDTRYIDCTGMLPEIYRKSYVENFCTSAYCAGAAMMLTDFRKNELIPE